MEKRFTQTGTFSIIVCTILLAGGIVMYCTKGPEEERWPGVLIIGVSLIIAALCWRMTIVVNDHNVRFIMGVGLIQKTYLRSDIESCKAVRNHLLNGIGIRYYRHGTLYNVSGLSAVELTFRNSDMRVRLGTDSPEEVCRAINTRPL